MKLWACGLLTPRWSAAILSLLVVGNVMAATARAGCTAHYVTSQARQADHFRPGFETIELLGSVLDARPGPETPAGKPASTPCTGALCSGNHAPPPSTTPTVAPPGTGQWAVVTFPIPLTSPGSLAFPPLDARFHPVDNACLVFHPPR